ncbi:calcium uniporter [Actinidia rufa]|uniref:Calcium uniporter n=1 Tax=Actinidia rufa TaxID=165716 RepID=A0A7J0FB47_9ERIC|nr:calcium uniporter [Actinidia rufa]
MALRRTLAKRLFTKNTDSSPIATLDHSPISSPKTAIPPNAAKTNFHRELLTAPDSTDRGFFRRFLQMRALNQAARLPEFLSIPVGDILREKLKSMNVSSDRLRLDGLSPPAPAILGSSDSIDGITVHDARKIMRLAQLEKVRSALRNIPVNSISYSDYVETCVDVCVRIDIKVAKSMEKIITTSIATPNDPRRKELDHMEHQKAQIDRKAQHLVQAELYCGLGYIVLQALGLMRLTFLGAQLGRDGAHLLLLDLISTSLWPTPSSSGLGKSPLSKAILSGVSRRSKRSSWKFTTLMSKSTISFAGRFMLTTVTLQALHISRLLVAVHREKKN